MSKILVPEKVTFYLKAAENGKYLNGNVFECHPSYPSSDINNTNAIQWTRLPQPETITVDNKFQELQIVDLTIRGEGGRAYQVLLRVGDKLLKVDLREDCLLDIITVLGICRNGVIDGSFCFCSVGSQFKLYRIGSDEYNKLLVTQSLVKVTKPVAGQIYQDKANGYFIYLGSVLKQDVDSDAEDSKSWNYYSRQSIKYSLTPNKTKYQVWWTLYEHSLYDWVQVDGKMKQVPVKKLQPDTGIVEFVKSKTCYQVNDRPEWTKNELLQLDAKTFVLNYMAVRNMDFSGYNYRERRANYDEFLSKPVPVTNSDSYYNYLAVSQMEWLT